LLNAALKELQCHHVYGENNNVANIKQHGTGTQQRKYVANRAGLMSD
jgi:hypothetical protein